MKFRVPLFSIINLFVAFVQLTGAESPWYTVNTQSSHRPMLYKDARQVLAMARAQGRKEVVLIIATREGKSDKVASHVETLGGQVRYRDDNVGYLRVRIPIERVNDLAEFDFVEAATVAFDDGYSVRLDGRLEYSSDTHNIVQAAGAADSSAQIWPPKLSDYPLRHPYSPLQDINANTFREKHPTYDGRGVTIAVLDGNYDLLLPEFQTSYTLDGTPIPKTADFLNATDPRDYAEDLPYNHWIDMRTVVAIRNRKIVYAGKKFTVPYDGTFRIGLLNEREIVSNHLGQDLDRNGNPKGDDGLFGVLWNEQTNDVFVDTDRDLSFANEKKMTDYIKRQDVGEFGKDNPATLVRESIGFTVQTDLNNKYVAINPGMYGHATSIMGSVVGNRQLNGNVEGIAPGARVVSIHYGFTSYGAIEGLIRAFTHPLVDIIVYEQYTFIATHSYVLADGQHPISIIIERLIKKYDKLLFVPGGNGSGLGVVAEDGCASGAMSVGAYQSKESYRVNNGYIMEYQDNMHSGGLSHGPSNCGALKPDILAPSRLLSVNPGFLKGEALQGLFELSSGYGIAGGTSTAAPMAAGAAALVISAAKQEGIYYNAQNLKRALIGSARFTRLTAHEQGNGLVQVQAAFEMLKAIQSSGISEPIRIDAHGPVRHALSHLYETPHQGYGIYERAGWKVGDTGTRSVVLTRTTGPKAPMTFVLKWLGNDGTFSSLDSVTLPFGVPVEVMVIISPKGEGAHTAILSLEHPQLPYPAHRTLNTIVVPYQLVAENNYALSIKVKPQVPGDMSIFVEIPEGASALTASVSSSDLRLGFISPTRKSSWLATASREMNPNSGSLAHPAAGVWEINLRAFFPAFFSSYKWDAPVPLRMDSVGLTVKALGVAFAPISQAFVGTNGNTGGKASLLSLTLGNRFAALFGVASDGELEAARHKRATITQGEQHLYEIEVPDGTTSLRAFVKSVNNFYPDLDVYLLDCVQEKINRSRYAEKEKGSMSPPRLAPIAAVRVKSDDPGGGGTVELAHPKPGRWVVVVDGYRVPDGGVEYEYFDAYAHPRFGSVTVADHPQEHKTGATWNVKGGVWVNERPEGSRFLNARVVVRDASVMHQVKVKDGWDPSAYGNHPLNLGSWDVEVK